MFDEVLDRIDLSVGCLVGNSFVLCCVFVLLIILSRSLFYGDVIVIIGSIDWLVCDLYRDNGIVGVDSVCDKCSDVLIIDEIGVGCERCLLLKMVVVLLRMFNLNGFKVLFRLWGYVFVLFGLCRCIFDILRLFGGLIIWLGE